MPNNNQLHVIECPHLANNKCGIAGEMAEVDVVPELGACRACIADSRPRAVNRVTVGLAIAARKRLGLETTKLYAQRGHNIRPNWLPVKLVSYAAALAKWLARGLPVRSEEQVKHIYRNICGPCPFREPTDQPEVSYCKIGCGCRLSDDPGIKNKIFFETEHCDDKRW
jgi:hypothetical protein